MKQTQEATEPSARHSPFKVSQYPNSLRNWSGPFIFMDFSLLSSRLMDLHNILQLAWIFINAYLLIEKCDRFYHFLIYFTGTY
jgi:hypothetical protein